MQFGPVENFQGLKFATNVRLETNIAAVVGRNGAGKSRLLKGIAEGNIKVSVDNETLPRDAIRLIALNELQPSLQFGFDPIQHRERLRQAVSKYQANKGKFENDVQRSIAALQGVPRMFMPHENQQVDIFNVVQVAVQASQILGKNVNDLSAEDIADFFSISEFNPMGSLNVTATVRSYWDRQEQNQFHEFRNTHYGEGLPYFTPDQFEARFGPAPWNALNELLKDVLDERYYLEIPTRANIATYVGRLFRSSDGLEIDPGWLSSGEKVLMWLCLSMYATSTGRLAQPPKLLLLDEPDGALHPQMVQKLHKVLRSIADKFGAGILFTTHSPTSIALFNSGPIWQVSEEALVEIDKDTAIKELLVGLDQVSIHYAKCRQVYVESHNDEDIYTSLFSYFRRWHSAANDRVALSFIPAAPKLASQNIRDILKAHFGEKDPAQTEGFIQALNGQGNCAQVLGAIESLNNNDGVRVYGIIDWDLKNQAKPQVHVLGEQLFYNIENAVLNPLTLGLYLLHNFRDQLQVKDYGLADDLDLITLYGDPSRWQSVADGVMRHVLKEAELVNDLECRFFSGGVVRIDRRYAHMNGHGLEARIKQADVYPFLKALRRPTLMMDVVQKGIEASGARTMPLAFVDLFTAIQAAP